MKSIKKKAEEYSFIEEGTDLKSVPYKDYNNYKMEGFKAGANYVLECIENALNKSFDELSIVIEDIEEGDGDFLLSANYLSKDMELKDRQKVKVIVIKED